MLLRLYTVVFFVSLFYACLCSPINKQELSGIGSEPLILPDVPDIGETPTPIVPPDWQAQHGPSSPSILALLALVHGRQNPPKSSCRGTRFLVTHLDDEHFEGLGSILGEIGGALGEAMHSNRTLVWGVGLPYLLDRTRDEWVSARGSVGAAGVFGFTSPLDCSQWEGHGGGAWACLFRSISTCSLEDASLAELVALGNDPYNDASRLKFMEHRRGSALYTLPSMNAASDLFNAATMKSPTAALYPRHHFAAALMAYLFRLVPHVAEAVDSRKKSLWSGKTGVSCPPNNKNNNDDEDDKEEGPVWTMHVRRGDVARNADTYGNRHLFTFDDFYAEAKRKAHAVVAKGGKAPSAIFIASDGAAAEWIQNLCGGGGGGGRGGGGRSGSGPSAAQVKSWPNSAMPRFFTLSPTDRYLTPYGSHTAAADGGCMTTDCSLQADDVIALRKAATAPNATASAERMMRVLAEAAEDLSLLARGDVFFGQASSFFSTTAMFLAWANRAGGADPTATVMPDFEGVTNGAVQTGLLSAGLNGTQLFPLSRGHERWIAVTKRLLGSLVPDDTAACGRITSGYLFACDIPSRRMSLFELLPLVPPAIFKKEAKRWLGAPEHSRIWGGECPLSPRPPPDASAQALVAFALQSVNHGEGHTHIAHQGQALVCWADAIATLRGVLKSGAWVQVEEGSTSELLARVEARVAEYRKLQIRKYTTRDGITRGLARAVRSRGALMLPPPRPQAAATAAVSGDDADAPLPLGAIYEPIHLECSCDDDVGKGHSLLVVGWKGVPSSYAAVSEGLLTGFSSAAAAGMGKRGAEMSSSPSLSVDFLAAPAYKKAWEWMHVEGLVMGVSTGGIVSRLALYRVETTEQDHLVPPALYGVKMVRHEAVSFEGGSLPPPPPPPPRKQKKKTRKTSSQDDEEEEEERLRRRRLAATSFSDLPRCPDVILRLHYPLDVAPSACAATRVFVFGTAESNAANDIQSFQQVSPAIDQNFWSALSPAVTLLTPSKWSKARMVESGAPADRIKVLPHGFDPLIFYPLNQQNNNDDVSGGRGVVDERELLRTRLGFNTNGKQRHCVVGLTVGHMRWKKGIDKLMNAALNAGEKLVAGECLRLIFKGVDALYGISKNIESLLDGGGGGRRRALAQSLLASGKLILDVRGDTLPLTDIADLYRASDFAVSPYRAEGFNLPVLEAAACGLPLIITSGGAADDFTDESFVRRIKGTFKVGGADGNSPLARHVEPDLNALTSALVEAVRDKTWRVEAGLRAAQRVRDMNLTWEGVARRHANLFFKQYDHDAQVEEEEEEEGGASGAGFLDSESDNDDL